MCQTYNPASGHFIDTETFLNAGASGTWAFAPKPGSPGVMRFTQGGSLALEVSIPGKDIISGMFLGPNFWLFRAINASAGLTSYGLRLFDLRSGTITEVVGFNPGPLSSSAATPDLNCFYSNDGLAFFIWLGEGNNTTTSHMCFRSDTGAQLAAAGQVFNVVKARKAEITAIAPRTIRIYLEPPVQILDEKPLPAGILDVQETCLEFPDAVIGPGVNPALASTTASFHLRNIGNDRLCITAIQNVAPFALSPAPTFPIQIDPGATVVLPARFSPTAVGNFGPTNLPVTIEAPGTGDTFLCAKGKARAPILKLAFTPSPLAFPEIVAGSTQSAPVNITNTGEAPVTLSVAASTGASPFSWNAIAATALNPGAPAISVPVTFAPPANVESAYSDQVHINSTATGSPHTVNISGHACVPMGVVQWPPAPFPPHGQVERGFRAVRYVKVTNTGDGNVYLRARIVPADLPAPDDTALFGLAPASMSITTMDLSRDFVINPTQFCGGGPTGPGFDFVAVNFFANAPADATPKRVKLILEELDSGGAPIPGSSRTFEVSATIITEIALDMVGVFDRSGSMSESSGSRNKAQAAVEAGRLLVQLLRPDVGDRISTVRFNTQADVMQPIVGVVSANPPPTQADIAASLNTSASSIQPGGGTSIAAGIIRALEQIQTPNPAAPPNLKRAIVVLTDANDNTPYQDSGGNYFTLNGANVGSSTSTKVSVPADVRVHGVGIGVGDNLNNFVLGQFSSDNHGSSLTVGDLTGEKYFQLEKFFLQVFMDSIDLAVITDPVFTINPGARHVHEFDMLRGDKSFIVVIFDKQGQRLPFRIESPAGEAIIPGVPAGFQVRVGMTDTARFVEVRVPAGDPARYQGRWRVVIEHNGYGLPNGGFSNTNLTHGGTAGTTGIKGPVDYGIAIGAGSNFRLQPYVTPAPVYTGDPITATAALAEAGLPALGCAVTVEVESPSGNRHTLSMVDNGSSPDPTADDGEYTALFIHTAEAGVYTFTFRADGHSRDGEQVHREAVRSKQVLSRPGTPGTGRPGDGRPGDPIKPGGPDDACCQRMWRLGVIIIVVMIVIAIMLLILLLR